MAAEGKEDPALSRHLESGVDPGDEVEAGGKFSFALNSGSRLPAPDSNWLECCYCALVVLG